MSHHWKVSKKIDVADFFLNREVRSVEYLLCRFIASLYSKDPTVTLYGSVLADNV